MSNKKVNVCYVIDSFQVGGANKLTLQTIKLLSRNRFNVSVISLISKDNDLEFVGSFLNDKETKIHLLNIQHKGFIGAIRDIKNILSDCDIVVSVLESSNFYCSIISTFILRNKIFVCTMHGLDPDNINDFYFIKNVKDKWTFKRKLKLKYIQWLLFRSYEHFIAVSINIREYAKTKYNLKDSKVTTIYHGIDVNEMAIRPNEKVTEKYSKKIKESFNLKDNDFILAYVGRLTYAKGLEELLISFKQLSEIYHNIKLLLIGDGERRSYLENYIKENRLANNCHVTGFMYNISNVYSLIDLFVLPSYAEGIPLTLMEAMFNSKVTLSSNVGGIPEIVQNNVNGFIFPMGDFSIFENKVINIYENKDKMDNLKLSAKARVVEHFDINKNVQKIEDLFVKVYNTKLTK